MERECCVRGYHVYIDVWDASIGEELDCHREPNNAKDPYAVKVVKSSVVVGHVPKKLSRIYSLFIRRGGVIKCRVAGKRRHSSDLPQGGMEIPCILTFEAKLKELQKLKKLLKLN